MRRAVDDVAAGTSGCVLVEGPAGIGKTRLLVEATRLATAGGARVLSARGSQLEQSFGFGAVRQLFEPALGDPDRREALLGGAAGRAAAVFDEVADDAPAQQGGFAVLHGLYWLTVNLTAAGPVALVVDDVQWCDSASLRYLAYLVKRLEGLPVLVVLGVRTGEPHADDALLAEIALDPSTIVLRPPPLSAEAAGALVRERLGEGADSFVDACHRMTSGNPLLLRQLLRALEDEGITPDVSHVDTVRAVGSRAVSALVTLRLRRLPAEVAAAARAVAVLGDTAELPTVAALAQRPEPEVAAALDALSRREILTDEDRLCFVHPLIREAVYDDLPAGERALHHERAAGLLQRQGAPAEQVAAHLLRSPRRGSPATVEVLRAAARTAIARGAADAAVLMLRRALEEPVTTRGAPDAARRARRGRGPGRRARRRRAPDRGLRPAARRPRASPDRCGHRPHPRVRLPTRRGHGLRPRRGGRVAGRPRRRAAGPDRAAADHRLHARPARDRLPLRPGAGGVGAGRRRPHARRRALLRAAAPRRGPRAGGRAGPVRAGRRPAGRRGHRAAVDRRRRRAAARRRGPRRLLGPDARPGVRDRRAVRRLVGEPVARVQPVAARPPRRRAAVADRRAPSSSGCGASPT